eukprot:UN02075
MFLVFVGLIGLAASAAISGVPELTFCNGTGYPGQFTVYSYSFKPNNIIPNENVTVTLKGTLGVTVTSGNIYEKATVGPIVVENGNYDLCEETAQAGLPCPIKAGPITLAQEFFIPASAPELQLTSLSNMTGQNGIFLQCVKLKVKL